MTLRSVLLDACVVPCDIRVYRNVQNVYVILTQCLDIFVIDREQEMAENK